MSGNIYYQTWSLTYGRVAGRGALLCCIALGRSCRKVFVCHDATVSLDGTVRKVVDVIWSKMGWGSESIIMAGQISSMSPLQHVTAAATRIECNMLSVSI